ncbi:3'-5' exonuclease [Gabonibacter chumensis]|uniref:3'-5' exonuclease n=1 Tax=Gabonibacter chumensis TaxID=2972474 RepID=UPI0025746ECB|nr:3'-5' exonuclease [Gabonibacter chumensis]MCR9012343.1 3'-5' exonuclease [Gabonibacter chumensis]
MYLFFDTETTGLPKRWNAPVTDVDNWPRLVQLAWVMCDDKGGIIEKRNDIIKPEGFTIPEESSRIHGITTAKAISEGEDIKSVLTLFSDRMDEAYALVAHNISFDECIVGAEFERNRMMTSLFLKPKYCTMKLSKAYCKLPGKQGFKSPKLSELHQVLFGAGFDDAHNALADVEATVRCFWKLRELKVIQL